MAGHKWKVLWGRVGIAIADALAMALVALLPEVFCVLRERDLPMNDNSKQPVNKYKTGGSDIE